LKEYLYTVKMILNFDETLVPKATMILKVLFIPKGHTLSKGLCF